MRRNPSISATSLAGAALALATLAACGQHDSKDPPQQQAMAPGRIAPAPPPPEGPRKDYLKSQNSDARRAEDSMPAPRGGGQ
jgi:hypothetical protein